VPGDRWECPPAASGPETIKVIRSPSDSRKPMQKLIPAMILSAFAAFALGAQAASETGAEPAKTSEHAVHKDAKKKAAKKEHAKPAANKASKPK
jgi:hypothetical protein